MEIFQAISDRRSSRKYKEMRVAGVTPLGYPDQEPKPRPRKELSEVVFYDAWQ